MTYPTQSWPAQPPKQRSKTPVIVLSVLAALMAVTATLFTIFYFSAQSETDRIATTQSTTDTDLKRADDRLQRAEADAKSAQSDLTTAQKRNSTLESERDQLATCTDAAGRYLSTKPDTAQRDEWFKKMLERCRDI